MVSNVENLNPQVMRYIGKELRDLVEKPLEGIAVIVNDNDVTELQAVIDGPADTPYAGGRFRVKLSLDKDFPQSPPKGFFLTKIFHPNVSSRGEICVNTLKRDWKPDLGIKHVLLTIKCLLIVPNPESALNEEAGKLIMERYDDYFSRARLFTDIHARSEAKSSGAAGSSSGAGTSGGDELPKKMAAIDKKQISKKEKCLKDKKKTLKRL
jgi:ubiquitin-conjugating enzyme E2 S